MLSPPATMNFTTGRFLLFSMDYKKLTKFLTGGRPAQTSCFCQRHLISKPLMLAQARDRRISLAATLPRVNFLGVIAGILALVSLLFPWWGIAARGFNSSSSSMGGSLEVPATTPISTTTQASPTRSQHTAHTLVLVLLSTALAIAGS